MTISTTAAQPLSFQPSVGTTEARSPDTLLPTPRAIGDADPGAEIAMLLFRAEKDRRNDIKSQIRANAETERREQDQQLNDMESKANAALASGIAGGLATAASAACSFLEVKPLAAGTGDLSQGATACKNSAEVKKLTGWSIAAEATGKTISTTFSYVSDSFNTDATRHGQAASRAAETAQTLREDLSEAKDTMNKALQFMSEFRRQHAEISLSIWRR